jgi:hypothetical protein
MDCIENVEQSDTTENFSNILMEKNGTDCLKQNSTRENFEVINSRIMRHPNIFLRIFGFYHEKSDKIFVKAYCIFIISIIWLNSLRYIFSLNFIYGHNDDVFSVEFLYKVIYITSPPLFATYSTIIFINQEFNDREKKLSNELNSLFKFVKDDETLIRKLSEKIKIVFLLSITIAIIQCFGFIRSLFFFQNLSQTERELFKIHLSPFHRHEWSQQSIPFKILISIVRSLASIHASFTIAYFISYCKMVTFLFDNFNKKFEAFLLDSENKTNEMQFDIFRLLHIKLVSVVRKMDVCYNQFLGGIILGSIIGIVIIGYLFSIRKKILEAENNTSNFGFILMTTSFTWLFIYYAADINTKVSVIVEG